MAWTSPRTWAAAETLTAALMNTHVRDNENWLANDLPRCSAVRTAAQSITNVTLTTISYTAADEYDTGSMHDPAVNASRITVPSGGGGLYVVGASVSWQGNPTGNRQVLLALNGAIITGTPDDRADPGGGGASHRTGIEVRLVAGDFVEVQVLQSSGGALNVTHSRFQARWVTF